MVGHPVSVARRAILARIQRALDDVPADDDPDVPRAYRTVQGGSLERFVDRLDDYGASVRLVDAADVAAAVAEACRTRGVGRIAIPPDFPEEWRPPGVEVVVDDGLDPLELESIGAAATGAALGIAETGTVVLDAGEGQGRRIL